MKEVLEIERKFLLKQVPYISFIEHHRLDILQHYIIENGESYRIRATRKGDGTTEYNKIQKTILRPGVNTEKVFDINREEFRALSNLRQRSISKTRLVVPMPDGLKWEIDVYDHPMCLVVAEIETPSEGHEVVLPDFIKDVLIMEVTQFKEFSNAALAIPNTH